MAERGAHLTATEQEKPSIFEVVASDSLNATFYPAIKRLCNVLVSMHPERLGWMMRHYDELFLGLNALVQQYYVRRFGGSLSEVFYGLGRQPVSGPPLSARSGWLAFASLVLWPYVRTKCEAAVERLRDDLEQQQPPATADVAGRRRRTVQQLVVRLFTGCAGVYDALQVLQYLGYMANRTPAHSLALRWVCRQQLVYAEAEPESADWSWSDAWSGRGIRPAAFITSAVFRGLELSAFFLQFVRWWQDEASQGSLMRLPVPEAPAPDCAGRGEQFMGICPVCVQSWEIPTAVAVSGYVYCYKCIAKRLATEGRCPVSNLPADLDDLIRVFEV